MSKFIKVQTQLADLDCIEAALRDLGLPYERQAIACGWGQARSRADLVVRKQNLPTGCLADLAFVRQGAGVEMIIDEMDQARSAMRKLLSRLRQRCAYHRVIKQARAQGLAVQQVTEQGGVLQIVLRGA
nr:DUF1257 domain-containing protein [Anaerolineae bacterium]